MINDIPESVKKRNRRWSISISDNLLDEIKNATKGYTSVSGFIRLAVIKELERLKKDG